MLPKSNFFKVLNLREGGTNAKGIQVKLKYQVSNRAQASYTFLDIENERNTEGNLPYNMQIDQLGLKFKS